MGTHSNSNTIFCNLIFDPGIIKLLLVIPCSNTSLYVLLWLVINRYDYEYTHTSIKYGTLILNVHVAPSDFVGFRLYLKHKAW